MPQPLRKYKDLNLSMIVNPISKDLVYLTGADAIKRSVKNIVLTNFFEKHFDDIFGCNVLRSLFNPLSFFTALTIQNDIAQSLINFEPRITILSLTVQPEPANNGYTIDLQFSINNTTEPLTISMFLERTIK